MLDEDEQADVWEEVNKGYAEIAACQDAAYLIEMAAALGFQRFDLNTPTTTDRVLGFHVCDCSL
jgi:hypothetical protein